MEISIIKIRRSWDCLIFVMEINILVRGYLHIATTPWGLSQLRCHLTSLGIPMLKIRRSHDRLIFNMGISMPGKDSLYIETVPWSVCSTQTETIGTCWPCSMMPYSIPGGGGALPLWESEGMRRGFAPHFQHLDDLFAPPNLTLSTILFRSCWVQFRSPPFSQCRRSFCPQNWLNPSFYSDLVGSHFELRAAHPYWIWPRVPPPRDSITWPQWVKSVIKFIAALPGLDGLKILAVHMHLMHILITYVVGLTIIRNISSNKVHPTSHKFQLWLQLHFWLNQNKA